jgi:hypothetical protein
MARLQPQPQIAAPPTAADEMLSETATLMLALWFISKCDSL